MICFANDSHRLEWPERAPGAPTRRSCDAASRFGLLVDEHLRAPRPPGVDVPLDPNSLVLFTGPSGAGKSTLLGCAADALRARGVRVVNLGATQLPNRPAVDLFAGSIEHALRAMARVGLGQADCFLRRPGELSDGQRWRLRLAVALDRIGRTGGEAALLVDECCAALDPGSTLAACATLRRAATRTPRLRVLCAGADPALARALAPDVVVRVSPDGNARAERGSEASVSALRGLVIAPGTMRDYAALASLHYKPRRPARPASVLVARMNDETVGALVVAHPTLNSAVRDIAWPGRYTTKDRSANARRLNAEVRTLARATVDPRYRGLGVAVELVRAYLRDPLTARTEGVGVMPGVSNFLEASGMTRHELPIRAPDARLLDAIAHAGVEPWRLAQGSLAFERACAGSSEAFVERELRVWARAGRAHKGFADAPAREVFGRACRFIACRPVGYTHERS